VVDERTTDFNREEKGCSRIVSAHARGDGKHAQAVCSPWPDGLHTLDSYRSGAAQLFQISGEMGKKKRAGSRGG